MPITRIASFTRDHTTLFPGCYISAQKSHAQHGTVTKFDLRFTRPNIAKLTPKVMHSLEHLLAVYFSEHFKTLHVDLSPMGCRTGFYLTLFGKHTTAILPDWKDILTWVKHQKRVPFATKKTCGSAAEHDYTGAVRALARFTKALASMPQPRVRRSGRGGSK